MHITCLHKCSSYHTCCPISQVHSCQSTRCSVRKCFPAGCCGVFFRGQEETTKAMSRKNQFIAVFYNDPQRLFPTPNILWFYDSVILLPVHHCDSHWHLFYNPQQPLNGRILRQTRQNGQLFNFFHLQSSYAKSPPLAPWVLEIPSPKTVYTKDARSLGARHNGVLLPLLASEAHFRSNTLSS